MLAGSLSGCPKVECQHDHEHRLISKPARCSTTVVAKAAGYDPIYQADSVEGEHVVISKCHAQGELVAVPLRASRPSTGWYN